MKNLVLMITALGLAAGIGLAQKAQTFTGEIMDSACAKMGSHASMMKGHTDMTEKQCTLGCVKNGAKLVLYDPARKSAYALDDQTKPEAFAGQKVKVTGTLDKATNTIHVENIAGA
jgi:hypothetical protein